MARIACLHVPEFPLAALLRAEPELAGRAVAVAERADPAARLVSISPAARERGVRSGLSVAQGRTIAGDLEIRVASAERLAAAAEALADAAASFSPRIESSGDGTVWLDADGLETLCGDETHLATLLTARCRRVGLPGAEVGIGSSRAVAKLAACAGLGVVPPGAEAELLAPLGLVLATAATTAKSVVAGDRSGSDVLVATAAKGSVAGDRSGSEIVATLARWGITTFGALAALPLDSVATRLGEDGLRLARLARGIDDDPLVPRPRPLRFDEAVDCEWAIDTFEPLSFLLRAALERLTARLDVRGFRAGDLELSLFLSNKGIAVMRVAIAAPTNEVKSLLALVRAAFETRPPAAAVESFRLTAVAEHLRAVELDLFRPAGPLPEELATTLARLAAIAGHDRVGHAVTLDTHRPEAFDVRPFESPPPRNASPSVPSGNGAGHVLALRAFRPPVAIEVVCNRGRPDFVRAERVGEATEAIQGRVVGCAGPWRLTGEWWGEPLARDDYDLELTDGGVYRVYREHGSERWFAVGSYD